MSVYSNPHPDENGDEPGIGRFKAALLARGAAGTILWFTLLAALIITFSLVANRCGDDDGGDDETSTATATDEPSSEADPEPTATTAPTATPEPTPTPAPTATPEPTPAPTPVPEVTALVDAEIDAGTATLRGVVPDEQTADGLIAAASRVLGEGRVTSELLVDPNAIAGTTITFLGAAEERTANQLIEALAAALPGAAVVSDGLDITASVDVVARLNALFAAEPVQFSLGSAEILPESVSVLDQVAAGLAEAPGLALEVQGHTDNSGADDANQALSEQRATAVQQYLVDAGVSAERLTARGLGESDPIADNTTEDGRQANRRIEFEIVN